MTAFYEIIALFSTADNRRSSDQINSEFGSRGPRWSAMLSKRRLPSESYLLDNNNFFQSPCEFSDIFVSDLQI